jgi:hypothetical protein
MHFLMQRQLPTRAAQVAHYRQVLELAGITNDVEDPVGGLFQREASGRPSG